MSHTPKRLSCLTHIKERCDRHGLDAGMTRRIVPLALTLILALAMMTGAVIRGMAQAAPMRDGLIAAVLCADDGETRQVLLDARGEPVDPAAPGFHGPCPDCLTPPPFALPVNMSLPERLPRSAAIAVPTGQHKPALRVPGGVQARAPPTKD